LVLEQIEEEAAAEEKKYNVVLTHLNSDNPKVKSYQSMLQLNNKVSFNKMSR